MGRESFERWSYQAMLRLICNLLYNIAGFFPLFSHFLHYMACLTWTYNFQFSICYNLTLLHDVDTMASCLLNWSMNYSIGYLAFCMLVFDISDSFVNLYHSIQIVCTKPSLMKSKSWIFKHYSINEEAITCTCNFLIYFSSINHLTSLIQYQIG